MTPPINSVSDDELIAQLRRLVDDQEGGDAVVLVQRQLFNRVVGRLAARRAANTPVDGVAPDISVLLAEPQLPGGLPRAYGGCTCSCHRMPGVMHITPCCRPGDDQSKPLMTREWFERRSKDEADLDVSVGPASPALPSQAVGAALTAYELQVLLGTSISGCNMEADRTFDLPAAWARLKALGLIDRADGLAIATDKGLARIQSCLTSPAAEPDYWAVWSATGTHIGTWPDKADAEKALQDYEWPTPKLKGSIKALYTHPAPSASREVTVTNEMVEMAADALERQFVAGGPDVSWDKAARAALLAALPEREVE